MIEFKMPSLGADMDAGILREWKVKPGDVIKRGAIVAEVEIQKGVVEIECFDEGIVAELLVETDTEVPVGAVMMRLKVEGESSAKTEVPASPPSAVSESEPEIIAAPIIQEAEAPEEVSMIAESAPAAAPEKTTLQAPPPAESVGDRVRATPLARQMAATHQLVLKNIRGTGDKGAITKDDIELALQQKSAPREMEQASAKSSGTVSEAGKTEKAVPVKKSFDTTAIRKAVAAAMNKSNREIPHYYIESTIDMSKALAWLTEYNKKQAPKGRLLTVVLLLKAVAKALEQTPELNATWEDELRLKPDIHIGFVVSLKGGGIIVPAIHNTNKKTPAEIMETLNDLIPRARALKLRSSELSDATVTVTSLGDNAAEKVFGVIYPPQTAIIGLGSIHDAVVVENGMMGVKPVMKVTLAGDHRASDGLSGSRFLNLLKQFLQNPESL